MLRGTLQHRNEVKFAFLTTEWMQTMATSSIGAKRLPELSRQLRTTL
jgi:hypothetical protein